MHEPTETIVVTFESDDHKRLHAVLMEFNFNFEVDYQLRVGRVYRHHKKPVAIFVKNGDEYLETYAEVSGEVQTDKEYSLAEWEWMNSGLDSTIIGEATFLERELHILINVRPHSLNTQQLA